MSDKDITVAAFLRDEEGYWQQYAYMSLASFRDNLKRATGRVVAVDANTRKLVAWSDERDAPKEES